MRTVERDSIRTPWGWLRGFAWFLLAWPLLGLLALGEMSDFDWDSILIAMLGPAGIGVILLLVERGLTRWFGVSVAVAGQPVPGILRDLGNLALTLAVLLGIDLALVLSFEEKNLFTREDLDAGPIAAGLLAGFFAAAVLLRGLHRLLHGPARHGDLGVGWDEAPTVMRFFGYLALIPMFLVCTVMIDYTMRGKWDYFGVVGWTVLPAILLLGLRSAMARSPRYWANDPWEAWLRAQSLALPWWIIGFAVGAGTCVLMMVAPFAMSDDEISFAGRIITGILLVPIGGFGLFVAGMMAWRGVPRLWRGWQAARRLARDPTRLAHWEIRTEAPRGKGPAMRDVWVRLRDGRSAPFAIDRDDAPLVQWLREHA